MKRYTSILILILALAGVFIACNREPVPLDLQPQSAYAKSDQYYENLRAYKASEHSICYLWFADYGVPTSPAYRFSAIPDSVDIVSLWGGIPKEGTLDREEMYEMRRLKGTKLVTVTIIRIKYFYKQLGITAYVDAYNAAYQPAYDAAIAAGKTPEEAATEAENIADAAGISAGNQDVKAHKTPDAEGNYPEWCQKLGDHLLKEMWDNDLDGIDLDYEPEGDVLSGDRMTTFIKYLAQYIGCGEGAKDPSKLLIIDHFGTNPPVATEPYVNYKVRQLYSNQGGSISDAVFNSSWPVEKQVFAENIGDLWKTGGKMEEYAAFQHSSGKMKGGFGAFHGQRDYNTVASGSNNVIPYGHMRRAIQLQNPAGAYPPKDEQQSEQ